MKKTISFFILSFMLLNGNSYAEKIYTDLGDGTFRITETTTTVDEMVQDYNKIARIAWIDRRIARLQTEKDAINALE